MQKEIKRSHVTSTADKSEDFFPKKKLFFLKKNFFSLKIYFLDKLEEFAKRNPTLLGSIQKRILEKIVKSCEEKLLTWSWKKSKKSSFWKKIQRIFQQNYNSGNDSWKCFQKTFFHEIFFRTAKQTA